MKMRNALILLTALLGTGGAAWAEEGLQRLRLKSRAEISGPIPTLADVLVLEVAREELRTALAAAPLLPGTGEQMPPLITHAQVMARLDAIGINLARVLVSGAMECTLVRACPVDATGDDTAPLLRNPREDVGDLDMPTLADVLRAHVDAELRALGGHADLRFEGASQQYLRLTTPPWEFSISSRDRSPLGLRTFRVLIRRDGHAQRRIEILAHVRLVRQVAVAARPLNPGNALRRDDLTLKPQTFDDATALGFATREELVGLQIRKFTPIGERITADVVKAAPLVARSRPVTVMNESGGVRLQLSGIALDSGGFGDAVRVRLGHERNSRRIVDGVVTALGTVRLVSSNDS